LENRVDVPRRPSVARNRSKSNAGTLFLVSIRPESSTDRIRPWAPQSIIAELEEAIQCGSQDKRVETLRRVIDLFLSGADRLNRRLRRCIAEADYFKLSETSAQRTLRFWKVRVGSV
jgi:hypothetical protein